MSYEKKTKQFNFQIDQNKDITTLTNKTLKDKTIFPLQLSFIVDGKAIKFQIDIDLDAKMFQVQSIDGRDI